MNRSERFLRSVRFFFVNVFVRVFSFRAVRWIAYLSGGGLRGSFYRVWTSEKRFSCFYIEAIFPSRPVCLQETRTFDLPPCLSPSLPLTTKVFNCKLVDSDSLTGMKAGIALAVEKLELMLETVYRGSFNSIVEACIERRTVGY